MLERGVILTRGSLDELDTFVRVAGFNSVTGVTSWGPVEGWNTDTRKKFLRMTPNPNMRSTTGDPSLDPPGKNDFYYVDVNRARSEFDPWYSPGIKFILGNEPNWSDEEKNPKRRSVGDIYRWAHNLKVTIQMCRERYPDAKLISPAVMLDKPDVEQYFIIAKDAFEMCDYIGAHVYEHWGWFEKYPAYTNQLKTMEKLYLRHFPNKHWYITEMGINDKDTHPSTKGERYGDFMRKAHPNVKGAVVYHMDDGTIDPNYRVTADLCKGIHRKLYV